MTMKILALLLATVSAQVWAITEDSKSIGNQPPHLQVLSETKVWRQLLGFDKKNASVITSKAFFIAPSGNNNAYAELVATIDAFKRSVDIPDQHAQCRFRGRYLWLSQQLDFNSLGITPVTCPDYASFSAQQQASSISVVFATGYLGNPASYYGHLLLKINSPLESKTTSLENTAINFGANVPANENMLIYIGKGIFGGYDSSFTHQQYFYHSHNYGESELRDLWEYELDLPRDALELLIAHLWELMGADYTYYFFNRNCAYRMGELLELIIDEPLVAAWRPWETPQAIMQRLGDVSYGGKPLVKQIRYHPSRQSKLYQRYQHLSSLERKLVHDIVSGKNTLDGMPLASLDQSRQHAVVDTLMDYYQFVRDEKAGDKDPNNERYRRVLAKRYLLPPGDSSVLFGSPNRPHLGRKPSYLSVGVGSNDQSGEHLEIHLRPAYYDALDAGFGHTKNGALSMGEFIVGARAGSWFIKDMSLLKIESISRNYTALPGDRKASWYLDVGAEQAELDCIECLSTKARAGYGYATSLWREKLTLATFAGGGFLGQNLNSDGLYLSATGSLYLHLSPMFALQLSAEQRHFQDSLRVDIYTAAARLSLTEQTDVRIHFAHKDVEEIGLSLGFYW